MLCGLPNVKWLLGDCGYDADWFRQALQYKGIRACIPGRKKRKTPVKYPSLDMLRNTLPGSGQAQIQAAQSPLSGHHVP
ncbi:hypothetical protein GCM10022290_02380 [Sagittula marina]